MLIWILGITCVILFILVIVLLVMKISAKKTMVGSVVAALAVGASSGSMLNSGPTFVVDRGKNTQTIFCADSDTSKLRPERDFIINRPLEAGHTTTLAVWQDTVLVLDYTYKKTKPCDLGKFTRTFVSVVVDDTLEEKE
jgi:hypothetical protein